MTNDLCECGHIRRVHLDGSGRCCHCRCDRFDAEILDREGDMSDSEVRAAAERLKAYCDEQFLLHRGKALAGLLDAGKLADHYLASADRLRWRPIETAPKDGSEFLASKGGVMVVGHMGTSTVRGGLDDNGNLAERVVDCFRMTPTNLQWNPTHWQPLPTPPEMTHE